MQARAFSIIILYSSQSPSTEVLSNQARSQFGTYVLLGSANADTQRMALGEVISSGTIGRFSGYYKQETAEMETAQRFYVPDIYKYKLNRLDTFRNLYKKGCTKDAK